MEEIKNEKIDKAVIEEQDFSAESEKVVNEKVGSDKEKSTKPSEKAEENEAANTSEQPQEASGEEASTTEEENQLSEYEQLRAKAKWYVLHTFSSYENVAKQNLEIVVDKYNLQERVFDIIIPMEDVMEEKNGKRKIVSRKVMPGYIIVKMIYGDDIWHAITRTRGITGFVGPKGRPLPLTSDEIRKMKLEKVTLVNIDVAIGDKVEVLEGALYGFVGEIITLDIEANKCRVMVEMFGRETPVDLTLDQIRKLNS